MDNQNQEQFSVVLNDEEQYSIWLSERELPDGWKKEGYCGAKEECLSYINKIWTDMRPKSLREAIKK